MNSPAYKEIYFTIHAPYIVHETIEGETIVMNLKNGYYYSFGGVGPAIWEMILNKADLAQIQKTLQQSFGSDIENLEVVVESFINDLKSNEIIIETEKPDKTLSDKEIESISGSLAFAEAERKAPVFQRYTDMQDVLLLDPIHDVDEKGWPEPRIKNTQKHE
jgi:hypothetical protein